MARSLHCLLYKHAYSIAAVVKTTPPENTAARVVEGDLVVSIQVVPVNLEPAASARLPGSWLSSQEQLIWNALNGEPLLGKQIAAKLGWDYSTKLRYLLSNLEDRGVLHHDEVAGYSRAPTEATGAA